MGEDIRKQMPKETVMFDKVDSGWKIVTAKVKATKYARVACTEEGLLKQLNSMNDDLEQIQKALDQYLEAKRQLFPRFYFVSNDDLLEILGQSRNPKAVMPHMLKCFDNIKTLELEQPPQKSRPMDAKGMYSADGEFVPFSKPCSLSGAVENWMTKVEDEMRTALRAQMAMTKEAHKKTKRDKWIQDWAGQLVIAVSQLTWTTDTERAIAGGKKKEKVTAKKGLKSMRKKQVGFLKKLVDAVRTVKNKVQKKKLVGLITIEVHSRDVLDKLSKLPNVTVDAFDWLCQLRYYWEKTEQNPDGDTVVRQTNTWFTYMCVS
jgi:dynein heavy chain